MNETSQHGSEGKQKSRTPEGPVGAILVMGAGIAGIQASLDLANSGFKVYLTEKSSAIGGKMATLDKTFPTNDCAMCIVSPKLVEVGRHPNVQVITNAELVGLEGTVGRFTAKIDQGPRYVSPDLCTGCGSCVEVCPIEVPSEFEQGLAQRKAIYKLYPQAIPNTFAVTKRGTAPCRDACPANISVQGYLALTQAGRFEEALALVRKDNPFPGISGLACPRPCERACTRREVDHAIQIRVLKHILFEHETKHKGKIVFPEPEPDKEERIAIIGGGPAGLTAACYLRLKGYPVTIFEADKEPGGSLRKLAEKVVPGAVRQAEIDAILNLGVNIQLDTRVQAEEILSKFSLTYHAVLLATGPTAKKGKGEDTTDQASETADVSSVFREFDPVTLQTNMGNIFVCGELALGKKPFIHAIGSGKEAAISIDRSLRRVSLREGRDLPVHLGKPTAEEVEVYKEKALLEPQEKGKVAGEKLAVEEASRCMACGVCCECYQCVEACPAGALDHQDREETLDLNVGSVILSPGFDTVPGELRSEFGYGIYPNVVTSIEFERILSASGPTSGHVQRPSDEEEPRRIAWIQCVGSRDTSCNRDYCSSVCCMYATKEAVIAREHDPNIEATIFYIDLRAFGKGFDDYVTAAEKTHGVRYLRAMVSKVYEQPETGNLEIRYADEKGEISTEEFDLVVLSVGVEVNDQVKVQAKTLGVEVDRFGFTKKPTFEPLATSRPGVFTCGVFNGPKDIPETVSEASGAAACASAVLSSARGSLVEESPFQVESSEEDAQDPRIGVFICHCGINISAIVDVKAVADYARGLPGVVFADHQLYACSQDNQDKLREIIQEHRLNRVVISSCSPRTHEPLFQETLQQAGLNKYLFDMANIRDQCSWVHRTDNERATRKAMRLTRMAVANVTQTVPLNESEISIRSELLVIGGGLAGMTAAKEAAAQGFPVVLVEQEPELGGHLRNLRRTVDAQDAQAFLTELRNQVIAEPMIEVLTGAMLVGHSGYLGNYSTEVMTSAGTARTVEHGAVVVATGGHEARPEVYGLGAESCVTTQTELEQRIEEEPGSLQGAQAVLMIQCAGSRDEERPYCSRICCPQAIKNAIALKTLRPNLRVDILYRDIRSYGLIELLYMEARKKGVNFIRYDPETNPLDVSFENGKVVATLDDTSLQRRVRLDADLLVLSVGVDAADTEELATQLKTPRNAAGFLIEAHAKLRPVDFATDGLYLAGLAHYPKSIPETISQAKAAVGRAATILAKESLRLSGIVSYVNPEQCAVCLTCVRACPYGVPFINEDHTAEINPALCHGCGICVAECPAQTIVLRHYTQGQLLAKIEALPEEDEVRTPAEHQAEAGSAP
jgi:heterodisulfide reductase subunit A